MATITEVKSDAHVYLVFDVTSMAVGEGVHSINDTVPDELIDTTIIRTGDEELTIDQTVAGVTDGPEAWDYGSVARFATQLLAQGADRDDIHIDTAFFDKYLSEEDRMLAEMFGVDMDTL